MVVFGRFLRTEREQISPLLAQGGAVVGAQPSDCRTICAARGTVLFLGSVRQRQLLRVRVVPGPWRAFAGGAMAG